MMEQDELKMIWQSYDTKLNKSLKLNLHCLGLIQTQKVRSQLAPLLWHRAIEGILHAVAIVGFWSIITVNGGMQFLRLHYLDFIS